MVRTRFAPSPTGQLHLGNLRVAVFNHLFTRHHGGAFVIRVEDTDRERNLPGALEAILEDLAWAGLHWDEGPDREGPFGPYRQSQREDRHREVALDLLRAGRAYRCFCSDAFLRTLREEGEGGAPGTGCPGACQQLDPGESERRVGEGERASIRFPVPAERIRVDDAVRGAVEFHGNDIGDFVILRADGRPTYNFAVVVDDIDMAITHVIRGAGHLSNTPKQALLFDALGAPRPVFAHLPMVLGADRKKLSKREGAAGVAELRAQGYPPDAVVNYLSLLGWSPGDDREVLSREELESELSLDRVGASDAIFDLEKLRWISAQHLARLPLDALVTAVEPFLDRTRFPLEGEALRRNVEAIRTRLHTFGEVNEHLELLYPGGPALTAGVAEVRIEGPEAIRIVNGVRDALAHLPAWDPGPLGQAVREAGKGLGARGPALFHPVRLALCGTRSGPDLGLVLAALGREQTLERLGSVGPPEAGDPGGSPPPMAPPV
jgi:glutamyl-tRNA synthetase